jgi:hypothetical protein
MIGLGVRASGEEGDDNRRQDIEINDDKIVFRIKVSLK